MKTKLALIFLLAASLLFNAACATTPSQIQAAPASTAQAAQIPAAGPLPNTGVDPVAVVKAYVATANTGDFQKTLALYAEDAVIDSPRGLFTGKQEIATFLETDVKTTRATPESTSLQGPFVIDTGTVSIDRFMQAGLGPTKYRSEYLVGKDGKIRFFAPVPVLTPDQTARWQAALAKAGKPAAPATNPIDVAKAYVEAANSGNFAQAISYYADDPAALVQNGNLLLVGKQQVANWLQTDVLTTRATPQDWQVQGNQVINTGTVSLARFKSLGIDPVQYRAVYIIQDGKIRFFRPTAILTPEQQAKVQAAQAAPTPAH